jgi:hypothetical protein
MDERLGASPEEMESDASREASKREERKREDLGKGLRSKTAGRLIGAFGSATEAVEALMSAGINAYSGSEVRAVLNMLSEKGLSPADYNGDKDAEDEANPFYVIRELGTELTIQREGKRKERETGILPGVVGSNPVGRKKRQFRDRYVGPKG